MQKLTPQQALQKIKLYCAYQERSHREVKNKLYGFGLYNVDVERILSELIAGNYLNEERFAKSFAGGKFRIKQWGKIKIARELKQKNVSDYNIKTALQDINAAAYSNTLEKLTLAKWKALKQEQYINREVKTVRYLMQRGFEPTLIRETLKKIRQKNSPFENT